MTRNDVLVLGSDGIFDNLFDGQIVAVVTAVQKAGGGPEVVITSLISAPSFCCHDLLSRLPVLCSWTSNFL